MKPTVTILAPGGMGAPLGKRLVENGLEVRTSLVGRSDASAERAKAAGMISATGSDLVDVDIVLSVVPPSQALSLAEEMAVGLKLAKKPPIYVDCNAINPNTAAKIASVIEDAGCSFVDGGIIGGPPREGYAPTLFVSGTGAEKVAVLNEYGLSISVMDGPVGAASALKMSYAGITKGLIAVASAMILAAEQAGAGEALARELAKSQSRLMDSFSRSILDMFGKAKRWAPEMEQISGFVAEGSAESQVYASFAQYYERLGIDMDGPGDEIEVLRQFFKHND